jgi:single-strand DNA-binding protein
MPGINHLTFGGNLARDPELRVTPNGTAICNFSVANNRTWKDESGADRSDVTFLDCEAWGKTGEIIQKFFVKGSPIIVWGRVKMDQWEDKTSGQKRSKLKLTINFPSGGFDFCGKTGEGSSSSDNGNQQQERHTPPAERQQQPNRNAPPARQQQQRPPATENLDEDVSF